MWTANPDFAGLAERQRYAIVIENGDFGGWDRHPDGAGECGAVGGVGSGYRRGLGQAVTFGNLATGDLEPFVGDHFLHRHAAAAGDLQAGKIELVESGGIEQGIEKRIHSRENIEFVFRQFLDEAGKVAWIWHQNI